MRSGDHPRVSEVFMRIYKEPKPGSALEYMENSDKEGSEANFIAYLSRDTVPEEYYEYIDPVIKQNIDEQKVMKAMKEK